MVYDAYVLEKMGEIVIDGKTWLDDNVVHVVLIDDDRGLWAYTFGDLDGLAEYDGDKSDFLGIRI